MNVFERIFYFLLLSSTVVALFAIYDVLYQIYGSLFDIANKL